MGSAFFWGTVGAGALVIGAVAALVLPITRRVLGLIMALGSGVLISAVSFDLVEEAVGTGDRLGAASLGLALGALTFYAGDGVIDRMGGDERKSSGGEQPTDPGRPSCSAPCSTASRSRSCWVSACWVGPG